MPDTESATLNVNLVLRWEYRLGSTLFLVYTRAQNPALLAVPGRRAGFELRPLLQGRAADDVLMAQARLLVRLTRSRALVVGAHLCARHSESASPPRRIGPNAHAGRGFAASRPLASRLQSSGHVASATTTTEKTGGFT